MSEIPKPSPQPVFLIRDATSLKALADPLRLRLLRCFYDKQEGRALSGRQLMGLVGEEGNRKIYYHLGLLEKAGLIYKVGEKKQRNLIEVYYGPSALNLQIAPELLQATEEGSPMVELARAYLGAVRADLPFVQDASPEEVLLMHREVTLPATQAEQMRQELREVIERYEALSVTADDAGNHRVTLVSYPCSSFVPEP